LLKEKRLGVGRAREDTRGHVLPLLAMLGALPPSPSPWHKSTPRSRRPRRLLVFAVGLALLGCGDPTPDAPSDTEAPFEEVDLSAPTAEHPKGLSPDAKPETYEMMRQDLSLARSAADGGGRAWLAEADVTRLAAGIPASSREHFDIVYEAGPLGIAEGGAIYFFPSPFWGWDTPQAEQPEAPGYTTVHSDADGVEFRTVSLSDMLVAEIGGRALEAGERVHITYGAGPAGALVDRYAERGSQLWVSVDGDGDGIRAVVDDPPKVDIIAGPPSRLMVFVPSTARPGEWVDITVSVFDAMGNSGIPFTGEVSLNTLREGLQLPEQVNFLPHHGGSLRIRARVDEAGVYRVVAIGRDFLEGLAAESNPMVVRDEVAKQLWGDLHGHSNYSDGTGLPEDFFQYARDVAGLDFAALTDHDHWGVEFLDDDPAMWQTLRSAANRFHEPGRFVTLPGYEWTSWLHGHRHVLYFADDGPVLSSLDPDYQTPDQLWAGLRGRPAMTFAHHSAGGPIGTNWNYPPDPELEPVTEIVSVHGSSEYGDTAGTIYSAVPGNFVRQILEEHGFTLGFIGSGDSHDGHPGLVYLDPASQVGGLVAVLAEENTRAAIRQALQARRVYATNGPRIWLRVSLDDHPMGSILDANAPPKTPPEADGVERQDLEMRIASKAPLERVDVIRRGQPPHGIAGEGRREFSLTLAIPKLQAGDFVYLRVQQEDGGMAWSSPFYAR
jgi:hypothetical protein